MVPISLRLFESKYYGLYTLTGRGFSIPKNLPKEVIPTFIDHVIRTYNMITWNQNSVTLLRCQIPAVYLRLILEILSLVAHIEPGYKRQSFASP
jgi:hypothetical protein